VVLEKISILVHVQPSLIRAYDTWCPPTVGFIGCTR